MQSSRLMPVSIYISRSTQKLYVRRNTHKPFPDGGEVFDASIEVPVTIRDPDRPIGTHIFTAMAPNGAGLRWTAVSIENGDGAKDALDRISIPKDVLDRIAPTALPRSSIIVSDEPLSRETNYRTEFVAVLSDQPRAASSPGSLRSFLQCSSRETLPAGGFFNFWDQPSQYQATYAIAGGAGRNYQVQPGLVGVSGATPIVGRLVHRHEFQRSVSAGEVVGRVKATDVDVKSEHVWRLCLGTMHLVGR